MFFKENVYVLVWLFDFVYIIKHKCDLCVGYTWDKWL
jgi:hypothetical protein